MTYREMKALKYGDVIVNIATGTKLVVVENMAPKPVLYGTRNGIKYPVMYCERSHYVKIDR